MRRGDVEVGKVHGDLDLTARGQRNTERLHPWKSAVAGTNGARDALCDSQIGGGEIDVVCDEDAARANANRAGAWMKRGTANIGALALVR